VKPLPRLAVIGSLLAGFAVACGALDNSGDLDVLSGVPSKPSPVVAPPDAGPDATSETEAATLDAALTEAAPSDAGAGTISACSVGLTGCAACTTSLGCPVERTACAADLSCLHAVGQWFECVCGVQFGDAGSTPDCNRGFAATGAPAQALSSCVADQCASVCGQ
jgi:hypothetical protein